MSEAEVSEDAKKFLMLLYDITEGRSSETVALRRINTELSLEYKQTIPIIKDLITQDFVRLTSDTDLIGISSAGIYYVETKLRVKKYEREKEMDSVPAKKSKLIFISHINEDSDIAILLKKLLLTLFSNKIEIFVSSDKESIRYGKEAFPQIKQNLTECDLALILCSPNSIRRPWINFEAGGSAILGRPTIPLCYGGLNFRDLPEPLSHYQGADADNLEDLDGMINDISQIISIIPKDFDISQSAFFNTACSLGKQKPVDKPNIAAEVKSTSIIKGENVEIKGSTSFANSEVQLEMFKLGDGEDKMRAFSAPTGSDGSFSFLSRSDSFEPGLYGVTIQQPNGEWTKVQFKVNDKKK